MACSDAELSRKIAHLRRSGYPKDQAVAIAYSECRGKALVFIYKQDSLRYAIVIASNAYRDREDEIVRQKALEEYVKDFEPGAPLLFWHGGDPIGEIVHAQMMGSFLVEVARELPNSRINLARSGEDALWVQRKAVWDMMEDPPVALGASIGFKHEKGDEQDGMYDAILKFETSVLPLDSAANVITSTKIVS